MGEGTRKAKSGLRACSAMDPWISRGLSPSLSLREWEGEGTGRAETFLFLSPRFASHGLLLLHFVAVTACHP